MMSMLDAIVINSRLYAMSMILVAACLAVLSSSTSAQAIGDKYYLRHSLIFFSGETPKISSNNIAFTDSEICGFSGDVYDSPILRRGDQVRITRLERKPGAGSVTFTAGDKEYTVSLENRSKRDFARSFELGFSQKPKEFGLGRVTSWKGVIKQYGFPIAKCNDSGVEKWFYILEFSPACGSFDGCNIWLSKDGIEASGYI